MPSKRRRTCVLDNEDVAPSFSCEILLWPTSKSPVPVAQGYVVGWEDVNNWDNGNLLSRVNNSATGHNKKTKTTLCACVVPASLRSGQRDSTCGFTLSEIERALKCLSERHKCRRHLKSGGDGGGDDQACACCTCVCIHSLQVLALWDDEPQSNAKTVDKSGLRIINNLAQVGPWWCESRRIRAHTKCDSPVRQLVWYDPIGGPMSLGHFRHSTATETDVDCVSGFHRTLMRLSEVPNLAFELRTLLDSDEKHDTIVTNEYLPEDMQGGTCYAKYSLLALLQRANVNIEESSLVTLHLKNRYFHSCQARPKNSPIIVQIPILYILVFLARGSGTSLGLHDKSVSFLPREVRSRTNLCHLAYLGRALADSFIGISIGYMLAKNPEAIRSTISLMWNSIHGQLLRENIEWLERFPVGFKLNVPLTTNMGREVALVISFYEQVMALVLGTSARQNLAIKILGLIGAIFGFSTVMAIAFDAICMSTIHIKLISFIFSKMFRILLHTISSLWKLFRGKKKNVLRNRTDSLHYDSIQMLLGTVLFTTCIFLFTTVLVYHVFFTIIYLALKGCSASIRLLYSIIDHLPLSEWIVRTYRPARFPSSAFFLDQPGQEQNPQCILISRLVSTFESQSLLCSRAFRSKTLLGQTRSAVKGTKASPNSNAVN